MHVPVKADKYGRSSNGNSYLRFCRTVTPCDHATGPETLLSEGRNCDHDHEYCLLMATQAAHWHILAGLIAVMTKYERAHDHLEEVRAALQLRELQVKQVQLERLAGERGTTQGTTSRIPIKVDTVSILYPNDSEQWRRSIKSFLHRDYCTATTQQATRPY
jgi:hypothetical protein